MSEEQKPVYAKQVIVVRKDLKMRAGKLAAQVSHAAMAPLSNKLRGTGPVEEDDEVDIVLTATFNPEDEHDRAFLEWLNGSFTKAVVEIENEQELLDLMEQATLADVPYVKIEDEGRTVFHGVRTLTCVSFGPCYSDILDELTGHLKLYSVKG